MKPMLWQISSQYGKDGHSVHFLLGHRAAESCPPLHSIHESIDEAAVNDMGDAVDKETWLKYATNQVRHFDTSET